MKNMIIQQKNGTFLLSYEIRILILGITVFILAIIAGFLFNGLLYGSLSQSPNASLFWILTAVAFLGLVAMLAVSSLVIRQNIVFLIFGATALALILSIGERTNVWQWLATGILFAWLAWARWQIRGDLENFVKPKSMRILGRGVKKIISGLVIFISVFYFFSPRIQQAENLFISRSLFETVLVPVEKLVQGFAPRFRSDMTVDEAILEIAGKAAFNEALKKEEWAKEAPVLEIENLKKQFLEQFKKQIPEKRQEISKQLGVVLEGKEKIADVFYDFILAKFRKLPAYTRTFFGVFMVLSLYFILRIAALPFGWLTLALAAGLFEILVAIGFVSVRKKTIEREIAEI